MPRRALGRGWLLALSLVGLACQSGPSEDSAPAQVYQVRGTLYQLPDPNLRPRQVYLRHEAIPEFVGVDGDVVGMDAMTMSFRLADDVSLEGIEAGDSVLFTLEVHWEGPPTQVTRLERRPAEPGSSAERSRPPATTPGEDGS